MRYKISIFAQWNRTLLYKEYIREFRSFRRAKQFAESETKEEQGYAIEELTD